MGVLSSAYLVSKEDFKQIRKRSSYTDIFFYPDDMTPEKVGVKLPWNPSSFSFDKAWDDLLCILDQGGFSTPASKLNYGMKQLHCDHLDFSATYLAPSSLRAVARQLQKAEAETLKERALKAEATDWWGEKIEETMYDYYLGDFEEFKQFLKDGGEQNCYFVLTTG